MSSSLIAFGVCSTLIIVLPSSSSSSISSVSTCIGFASVVIVVATPLREEPSILI